MWRRLSKPDEAMDFLNYVVETSKGWDEPNPREVEKMRPSTHKRGGIFALSEDMEMKAKISNLARKVEELEGKRLHEVQAFSLPPFRNSVMFCLFRHSNTLSKLWVSSSHTSWH